MSRTIAIMVAVAMLPVATADAQGRNDRNRLDPREVARAQGVPPGQLPPADMCRVWYEGQPPGRQPRETNCRDAERAASRTRNARVIYGENVYGRSGYGTSGAYGNNTRTYPYPDNDRGVNRIPGRNRAPSAGGYDPYDPRYPDPRYPRSPARYGDTAFENGYRDGREQGVEDGRDNDRQDATRHGRYRSADRGYIDTYGDKTRYKNAYRDGFQAGYSDGYREGNYRR